MGQEIERKWLWNWGVPLSDVFDPEETPQMYIEDYYFNDNCRLRHTLGMWIISIKSKGNLIRDEFEFLVDKEEIDFVPAPRLTKVRYFVDIDGRLYEINIFKDLGMNGRPLTIVELELEYPHEVFALPDFCGQDVTYEEQLYGYNLYKALQPVDKSRPLKYGNVIPFRKKKEEE